MESHTPNQNQIVQSDTFDQSVIDLIHTMEYHAGRWYVLTFWNKQLVYDQELLSKYFDEMIHEAELNKVASFNGVIHNLPTGRQRIHARFIDSAVGQMVFEKFYKPGYTVQHNIPKPTLEVKLEQKKIGPAIVGEGGPEIIFGKSRLEALAGTINNAMAADDAHKKLLFPKYNFGSPRPVVCDHDAPKIKGLFTIDFNDKVYTDMLRQTADAFDRLLNTPTNQKQLEATRNADQSTKELPAPKE